MSPQTPSLAIGQLDGALYVALHGRATQRTCPTAEQLVSTFLEASPREARIVFDLEGSDWVDSTFAGWLIGVARRAGRGGGGVVLGNASPRCVASLEKMRVSSMFQFAEVTPPAETRTIECLGDDQPDLARIKLMLEAHQELADVDEQNASVFGPIVTALREQIGKVRK